MSDLISRQAAIDAVVAEGRNVDSRYLESERIIHESDAVEAIAMLPSAQKTVIIRCKDCKFSHEDTWMGRMLCERYTDSHETDKDGFCSKGKRRE